MLPLFNLLAQKSGYQKVQELLYGNVWKRLVKCATRKLYSGQFKKLANETID